MQEFASGSLEDFIQLKGDHGRQCSFVGVWKTSGANTASFIEPFWNLPFSAMLSESLASGLLDKVEWHSEGGRIDLLDNSGGNKTWVFSMLPQEKPEEVSAEVGNLGRQFAAMAFITELRKLLLRKRRTSYETRQMTLAGRAKGKILVGATMRKHLSRGRMDLIDCAVPIRTENNRVNQVFRYTLRLCKQSLQSISGEHLQAVWTWINFCDDILSEVEDLRSTRDSDYAPHGLTGFYKEHANLLALAKVIKHNHPESLQTGNKNVKTIPFLLNTWFVFESWIACQAREVAHDQGWTVSEQECLTIDKNLPGLKPDLVFKKGGETRILDVKYKKYWQDNAAVAYTDKEDYRAWRGDFHQVLAYGFAFNAEKVGLIFPSKGTPKRSGFEEHPVDTEYFALLPVVAKSDIKGLRDKAKEVIKKFLP